MELVTGVALITLLFMMLQTEHERCDRVRAGWREVRRSTFATTTAIQSAIKNSGQPGAQSYLETAQNSTTELYSTILLYGKGALREEYRVALKESLQSQKGLRDLLNVFPQLDRKAEQKFRTWRLVIL